MFSLRIPLCNFVAFFGCEFVDFTGAVTMSCLRVRHVPTIKCLYESRDVMSLVGWFHNLATCIYILRYGEDYKCYSVTLTPSTQRPSLWARHNAAQDYLMLNSNCSPCLPRPAGLR